MITLEERTVLRELLKNCGDSDLAIVLREVFNMNLDDSLHLAKSRNKEIKINLPKGKEVHVHLEGGALVHIENERYVDEGVTVALFKDNEDTEPKVLLLDN